MQFIDDGLKKFQYLVVLVLTGNFLQQIPGKFLPRKLQFLELYANEISELRSLVRKAPKRILHIGLGRNRLSQGTYFLLVNSQLDIDFAYASTICTSHLQLNYIMKLRMHVVPEMRRKLIGLIEK